MACCVLAAFIFAQLLLVWRALRVGLGLGRPPMAAADWHPGAVSPPTVRDGRTLVGGGLAAALTVSIVLLLVLGHHAAPGLWAHICGRPWRQG